MPAKAASQEAWPGAEPFGRKSIGREPRWNADRRAHPAGCAAVPAGTASCNTASVGVLPPHPFVLSSVCRVALSEAKPTRSVLRRRTTWARRLAPLPTLQSRVGKTRARRRGENGLAWPAAQAAEGRSEVPRKAKEVALTINRVKMIIRLPKRMTAGAYMARFRAEKAWLQRHYCVAFGFWRTCAGKRCRRARTCVGDAPACLKRNVASVPREAQFDARQRVAESTPANIGAPERFARGHMAAGLCDE
jgi:hypothetical protein